MVQPLRGCAIGWAHPHRAALLRCGVTVGLTKVFALRAMAGVRSGLGGVDVGGGVVGVPDVAADCAVGVDAAQ